MMPLAMSRPNPSDPPGPDGSFRLDPDTMTATVREQWMPLVRLATLLLNDRAVAEEVVQEACEATWRRRPGVTTRAQLGAYLRTAVVNGSRSVGRRRGTAARHLSLIRAEHDIGPTVAPDKNVGPFIMNPEGVARLFTRGLMRDGPFPAHYEPFESPQVNLTAPKIRGNPASRIFKRDLAQLGNSTDYPYAATSYRLTEHFHFWTKHARVNAILQPEFFVEISEQLAAEKGVNKGDWVRVWSPRGSLKAKAVVTKRIKPLMCDGKAVHVVGIPHHFGFTGSTKPGFGPNTLTPVVGDANIETPEFKAWLVNLERTTPPVGRIA